MSKTESVLEWLQSYATGELRDADMVLDAWRSDDPQARRIPPVDIERIVAWLGMTYIESGRHRHDVRLNNAAAIGREFGLTTALAAAFGAKLLVNDDDLTQVLNGTLTGDRPIPILDIRSLSALFMVSEIVITYRLKQLKLLP